MPIGADVEVASIPAAIAEAVPPEEPPAILVGSQALPTAPKAALLDVMPKASSCMLALPSRIAPASRNLARTVASVSGTQSFSAGVPALVATPAEAKLSLTAMVTP